MVRLVASLTTRRTHPPEAIPWRHVAPTRAGPDSGRRHARRHTRCRGTRRARGHHSGTGHYSGTEFGTDAPAREAAVRASPFDLPPEIHTGRGSRSLRSGDDFVSGSRHSARSFARAVLTGPARRGRERRSGQRRQGRAPALGTWLVPRPVRGHRLAPEHGDVRPPGEPGRDALLWTARGGRGAAEDPILPRHHHHGAVVLDTEHGHGPLQGSIGAALRAAMFSRT